MNPNDPNQRPEHQPPVAEQPSHPPLQQQQSPQQQQYQTGDVIQPGQPLPGPSQVPAHSMKFGPKDWMIIFAGLAVVAAIIIGIVALFNNSPGAEKNRIKETGIEATATSDGKAFVFNQRISKNYRKVTYRAYYTYTATDGKEYRVTGDKDYESEENVAAKKGMKTQIKYAPDDPYHPVFLKEE